MTGRGEWVVTTHDWMRDVDEDHLASMRQAFVEEGAALGKRHLILEVLAYAQDEAASAGRRGSVLLTYRSDGSVCVDDDGRGTDTRVAGDGRVVRKPVMATADVRFIDPGRAPLLPDGQPRRGMSLVSAVSDVLVHENHRSNGSWSQTYRYGIPDADLAPVLARGHSGTVITLTAEVDGPSHLTDSDVGAFSDLTIHVQEEGRSQSPDAESP